MVKARQNEARQQVCFNGDELGFDWEAREGGQYVTSRKLENINAKLTIVGDETHAFAVEKTSEKTYLPVLDKGFLDEFALAA